MGSPFSGSVDFAPKDVTTFVSRASRPELRELTLWRSVQRKSIFMLESPTTVKICAPSNISTQLACEIQLNAWSLFQVLVFIYLMSDRAGMQVSSPHLACQTHRCGENYWAIWLLQPRNGKAKVTLWLWEHMVWVEGSLESQGPYLSNRKCKSEAMGHKILCCTWYLTNG